MTFFKLLIYGFLTIVVAVKSEILLNKTHEFKCEIPEPRFIYLDELFKKNNFNYQAVLPVGLTLHRCESFRTCKKEIDKECIPPVIKDVKFSALVIGANHSVLQLDFVAKNVTGCDCWNAGLDENKRN